MSLIRKGYGAISAVIVFDFELSLRRGVYRDRKSVCRERVYVLV